MTQLARRVGFATEPSVGLAIVVDGHRYDFVAGSDHVRLDGVKIRLLEWASDCAECGATFLTKSPLSQLPASKRCHDHRQPGVRVRRSA